MELVKRSVRSISTSTRSKVSVLALMLYTLVSMASAQTGDWDISGAQGTVTSLLAAGAVITIALTLFKLAKRATSRV